MKVFRLNEENHHFAGAKKCPICHRTCRIGQTIVYVSRRGTVIHRYCLFTFLKGSYEQLPRQPDEYPGHDLFSESREQQAQREFDEYRAQLQALTE